MNLAKGVSMSNMQVAHWQHYNVNGEFLGQSEEHPTTQRRVLPSDVIVGFVAESDALAAIKALQDRIDTLNSSLECEKRMRKDSDERMENAEAALKAARVQAVEGKMTHEQAMAGYTVACRFGVLEARAFNLAEQMWKAFQGKEKPWE